MRAADIEPQHVRQYLDARAAKVAANREKALLSHVLTKTREWGVMARASAGPKSLIVWCCCPDSNGGPTDYETQ